MPAKTGKQYRYMQMMAHNPESARMNVGPSKAVAREFIKKTPKSKRSRWSRKPTAVRAPSA